MLDDRRDAMIGRLTSVFQYMHYSRDFNFGSSPWLCTYVNLVSEGSVTSIDRLINANTQLKGYSRAFSLSTAK